MTVAIELTQALQIEALRSNGFSNDEILYKLKRQQINAFEAKVTSLEFDSLLKAYEANPTLMEKALREGFEAKSMTIEAAKFLLESMFSAKEGDHFMIKDGEIVIQRLTPNQKNAYNAVLPEDWKITVA